MLFKKSKNIINTNVINKVTKSPFIPLFQRGTSPLYQEGIKGCVPLFGKEG
jgi:hypothetical protein